MSHFRSRRAGLATLLALASSACATGYETANQEVALRATEGGKRVEARCEIVNGQAGFSVVTPVTFGVTRTADPLNVQCRTAGGSQGARTFDATRQGSLLGGVDTRFARLEFPPELEVAVVREGRDPGVQAPNPASADLGDVDRLPRVGENGREGYRRFLAGEFPRAFAIAGDGRWVRVNAARDAPRLALDRCQSHGSPCRLYAVDDQVVWERRRAGTS